MAFWKFWQKNRTDKKRGAEDRLIKEEEEFDFAAEKGEFMGENREPDDKKLLQKIAMEKGDYDLRDEEERRQFLCNRCEVIAESDRQIEETTVEFDQVTSYLTDIQKIDRIHGEERELLMEVAKRLLSLEKERAQFKKKSMDITDAQMQRLEPYQETLGEEVKKMYANESYQEAIISDLRHLKAEKTGLLYEREDIRQSQEELKIVAKFLMALFLSLCVLLLVITVGTGKDMLIPFMSTFLLATVAAAVIVNESRKNKMEIKQNLNKLNKAIRLQNRVKIKYVNNTNVLAYTREKYGVESAEEFEKLYGQYQEAKAFEKKIMRNTELLHRNQENLMAMLEEAQVADTEVWLHQVEAIVDEREMVEVRHRLNVRRRSLRERVEFNKKNRDEAFGEIADILEKYPSAKEDILRLVKEYGIKLHT